MSKDNYQSLTTYKGDLYGDMKPSYQGIEYDYEVPDNLILASPGGISSVSGHYTKGFYGRGNTSSDIYAGQGQTYISGQYGSLYESGHSASDAQGYYSSPQDYQFYQNYPPQTTPPIGDPVSQGYMGGWIEQRIHPGASSPYPGGNSIEGYTSGGDDGFELIGGNEDFNTSDINSDNIADRIAYDIINKKATILIPILIILSITLYFWCQGSNEFLKKMNGGVITWKGYCISAIIMTIILFCIIKMIPN